MTHRNRYAKMTWILSVLAISFLCTAGCGSSSKTADDEPGTARQEKMKGDAGDSVKHKVMSFDLEGLTDSGAKKWDVKGESAEAISETRVKLNNITASSYGDGSQATIRADKGVYDKAKNNVCLEENVKATIENSKDKSSGFMDFSSVLDSTGKASGQSSGKNKKTKTVITCDGEVQFDYEKNQAYFNKNVKVVNEEGSIDADKITLDLDPATKKIMDIVAEGNVKIKRGENMTYSDKAVYVEADKRILLTGQPKIVICQDGTVESNFLGK